MPLTPSPAAAGPRRRALLTGALRAVGATGAVAGLGLLTGCSDGQDTPADAERSDAARRLRRLAARDSEKLLAKYEATLTVHSALASRLRPLRESVARHAQVLAGEGGGGRPGQSPPEGSGPPGPSGSPGSEGAPQSPDPSQPPSPSGSPRATRSPDTADVPVDEEKALAALAREERRLAAARTKALAEAPPGLARLLASVAAAGSAHVYLLEEDGGGGQKDAADTDDADDADGPDDGKGAPE